MSKNTISGALLMLASCALLAVVVAASAGVSQNANSSTTNANANSSHGAMKVGADQKFAAEAALGGMEEVELGRIAAQKGTSDEVRQFGQRMVDDHSKAGDDLKQVAAGKGWTLPAALDAKHQADVQKLSALSGEKFDKEYVNMMLKDHKKDVAEFQKEAARGADADIKSFATRTLPTLQEHLQMIQRIHDKMALRKSGNLTNANANAGGGMDSNMNANAGGNTNSNKNKGKNKNSNGNSNSNNSNT